MKFLPLLFLYIVIVFVISTDNFVGDESRYIMFADNLTHGHYSPKDDVYLWNGPGYPIILAPFILLKLPWLTAKLLNAVFLFLAVLYFYKTLQIYIKDVRRSTLFSYLLGVYPTFFVYIPQILTEILSVFLICGFIFHFCKLYYGSKDAMKHLCFASLYLAYLALTKIFFGYVIFLGSLIFLSLYLWKKKDTFKKAFTIYLLAFLLCSPYLLYTYSLTNRILYWGDSGGLSLYWMSTPYENEFGDWYDFQKVQENSRFEKHQEFFNKLKVLPNIQRDDELKKQAVKNIMQYPAKYLKNVSANVGRMLFNYPYSYRPQKMSTYFYIIPNMFLVVCSIMCIYPYFARGKIIPVEIHILIVFFFFSFVGSALLSAYPRQLMVLLPVLLIWLFLVITHAVRIELRH
ncbi:MAG: hypothetical protein HZC48_05615 [Nitrospirae bacterium]|nr:hypothetical protein [Nitrospirota bacterium]